MSSTSQDFEYYKDHGQVLEYDAKRFRRGGGYVIHSTQLHYIQELLKAKSVKQVLDVPVGTARISRALTVERVVGLDISPPMIKYARQASSELSLALGSAFQLPFQAGLFDLVISLRFVRHLCADDRARVYAECQRVLDDRGTMVFDAVPKSQEFDYSGARLYSGRIYDVLYEDAQELINELTVFFRKVRILPVFHFPNSFTRIRNLIRPWRARPVFDKMAAYLDPRLGVITKPSREWLVICEK